MRAKYAIKTAPTSEPITTAEAKSHMYVTASDDDTYIGTLITAARVALENILDRAFFTQTWYGYFDTFPDGREFRINKSPLVSITAITYTDENGDAQTMASGDYQADIVSEPARVALVSTASWPGTKSEKLNAVRVEFVAGAASVPENYKLAIKMLVAHAYQNREATITGTIMKELDIGIDFFASSHMVYTAA